MSILHLPLWEGYSLRLKHIFVGLIIVVVCSWLRDRHLKKELYQIPAIEVGGFLSSIRSKIAFTKRGRLLIDEGYNKYKPRPFRLPLFKGQHVVLTNDRAIDELRKYSDDSMSFTEATNDIVATDYIMSRRAIRNPTHIPILRNQFTNSLGMLFPEIRDEMLLAFEKYIPATEDWSAIRMYDTSAAMICRISNRLLVGAPYCRDPEFMKMNIDFVFNAVIASTIMDFFPGFLKPIVMRLFTRIPSAMKVAVNQIQTIIQERETKMDDYGTEPSGRHDTMLTYLLEMSGPENQTVEELADRIVLLNFASLHSTSVVFTLALFDLASRPEYVPPLREEVENHIKTSGWTKESLDKMEKLESFLKECLRFSSTSAVSLLRKAMNDVRLCDGTLIPKGTTVSAAIAGRQHDDALYTNAATFDGFRFCNPEEEAPGKSMSKISLDYLPFGHGRHACPGRFFAALEMKLLMAHILLNYDIKLAPSSRPLILHYQISTFPDSKAEVLFKKRS